MGHEFLRMNVMNWAFCGTKCRALEKPQKKRINATSCGAIEVYWHLTEWAWSTDLLRKGIHGKHWQAQEDCMRWANKQKSYMVLQGALVVKTVGENRILE